MPHGTGHHGIATRRVVRRGFTLVEVIFSILLIGILLSIALVGIQAASRSAQGAADRQAVLALKVGVDSFKQEFGFLPPLTQGSAKAPYNEPFDTTSDRVKVFSPSHPADVEFLRGRDGGGSDAKVTAEAAFRFSLQSLPYYLVGSLDKETDGIDGPGFRAPRRDGSFASSGPSYPSYVDASKRGIQLWQSAESGKEYLYEFRDRNGIPIRYYRWLPQDQIGPGLADLNVPKILGNAADDGQDRLSPADSDPGFRDAEYAIVAAGPNRAFGDIKVGSERGTGTEDLEAVRRTIGASASKAALVVEQEARSDNIVETGK